MPSVGFEPTISVGERPQTFALDVISVFELTSCTSKSPFIGLSARIYCLFTSFEIQRVIVLIFCV
jgi:hypothetical protein